MKWFEHRTDAHGNKKIRKIEIFYKERGDQAVMAAIGRFWRLHEIVGTQGQGDDGLDTFSLPDDYGLDVLADDLYCSQDELVEFFDLLAEINSIDADAWQQNQRVYLPKLAERADTYTKRLAQRREREKSRCDDGQYGPKAKTISGECSNIVRTDFEESSESVRNCSPPQTQTQTQAQEQRQTQKTKAKDVDASSQPQPPNGGNGDARPQLVFSCPHFEIDQEYFDALLQDYPGLSREVLNREIRKAADWITDNPGKHKRKAKTGHIANPRSFLRRWLEKVEVRGSPANASCSPSGNYHGKTPGGSHEPGKYAGIGETIEIPD
jgi:hypothetical protein